MREKQQRYWAHDTPLRSLPVVGAIIWDWFEFIPQPDPRQRRLERRQAKKAARRQRRKVKLWS